MSNFSIFMATMASCIRSFGCEHPVEGTKYSGETIDDVSMWCAELSGADTIQNELLDGKHRMLCEMVYQFYCDLISLMDEQDITDARVDELRGVAIAYMIRVVPEDIQFFEELKNDENIPAAVRESFSENRLKELLDIK